MGSRFAWVVSYPKSGNTWMRSLLREYFRYLYGEVLWECNDNIAYFYHVVSPVNLELLEPTKVYQLRPTAMMHMLVSMEARANRVPLSVVKSHSINGVHEHIPFFSRLWVDKVIYVHRDPREILPSLAAHSGDSMERTVEYMADDAYASGRLPLLMPLVVASWSSHVLSWYKNEVVPTHVVSYREMHEDTVGVLRGVLKFLGFEVSIAALAAAVINSDFEALRDKEERGEFRDEGAHDARFFRRGKVGEYADEVPEGLVQQIESEHNDAMQKLGYL